MAQKADQTSFSLALKKFKAELTAKEKTDFELTTLQDLQAVMAAIQKTHISNRKSQAMDRLKRFLEAMEQYDKVVGVFLNASSIVAFVWGPIKFLLLTTSNFVEAFNIIVDAYEQIGDRMPLLMQYHDYFTDYPWMSRILPLIYEDLLEFHCEALKFFRRKAWFQLIHALWKTFQTKFGKILKNLERHQSLLQSQAGIAQFQESCRAREIAEANYQISKMMLEVNQRKIVHDWLEAAHCETDQDLYSSIRDEYPTTTRWICKVDRFRDWLDPDFCCGPLLWINGIPGAGKTILASFIVEEARKVPSATTAFFYCKEGDLERSSFLSLAKGILLQLLRQSEADLLPYLFLEASKSGQSNLSTFSLARKLLETCLTSCETVYLVLDGIDECDKKEREKIATVFQDIVDSMPVDDATRIRCVFLSQDDSVARKDFATIPSYKISALDNQADICLYAEAWAKKIGSKFRLSMEREKFIVNMISERSEGMFLFARLVTRNLLEQPSREALNGELDPSRFPGGSLRLEKAYSRIIRRIFDSPTESRNTAISLVLGWLVCSKRQMKWREIQAAMAIDMDKTEINWEDRELRENSKELCGSLVEMMTDGTVKLVHQTAKSYLVDKKIISLGSEELRIALLCLGYLSLPSFAADLTHSRMEAYLLRGQYAFFEYALAYWSRHLEMGALSLGQDSDREELAESVSIFIDQHWIESDSKPHTPKTLKANLKALQGLDCFSKLTTAATVARKQLNTYGKNTAEDQVLDLFALIKRVRTVLEGTGTFETWMPMPVSQLSNYYGKSIFKCPQMSCVYFYEGFQSLIERDEHVKQHERLYFCSFPGCLTAVTGCVSKEEMQKHEIEKHNIIPDNDLDFPDNPEDRLAAKFSCPHCSSEFTRKHNLKLHILTHKSSEEEPRFPCNFCSQLFRRSGDRTRHEASSHRGGDVYACGGYLSNASKWGCGREFNRAENLARHYASKRGMKCIQPLHEEEAGQEDQEKEEREPQGQDPDDLDSSIPTENEKSGRGLPGLLPKPIGQQGQTMLISETL